MDFFLCGLGLEDSSRKRIFVGALAEHVLGFQRDGIVTVALQALGDSWSVLIMTRAIIDDGSYSHIDFGGLQPFSRGLFWLCHWKSVFGLVDGFLQLV